MDDEYLWQKSGTPDAEVERLEKLLSRYRHDPAAQPLRLPADHEATSGADHSSRAANARLDLASGIFEEAAVRPSAGPESTAGVPIAGPGEDAFPGDRAGSGPQSAGRDRRLRIAALALAAGLALALAIGLWSRAVGGFVPFNSPDRDGYRLIGVAGRDRVRAGEEIVTGVGAGATLEIGLLGRVDLRPGTRLRIEAAQPENHSFYLDRGSVHAKIFTQPRRFQIGTPAGRSIDLGCEYSLEVGDDGVSRLHVLTGQVAFEFDGREVYVPAGATCISVLARGPSAPVFDAASDEFKQALAKVESEPAPPADALARVLACDPEEALSVWHLFDSHKTPPELRKLCYDRLSQIFAKPPGVTDEGLLAGDRSMRRAWLETMKPWWR